MAVASCFEHLPLLSRGMSQRCRSETNRMFCCGVELTGGLNSRRLPRFQTKLFIRSILFNTACPCTQTRKSTDKHICGAHTRSYVVPVPRTTANAIIDKPWPSCTPNCQRQHVSTKRLVVRLDSEVDSDQEQEQQREFRQVPVFPNSW